MSRFGAMHPAASLSGRRQILWFGVTAHPTAEWIANNLRLGANPS